MTERRLTLLLCALVWLLPPAARADDKADAEAEMVKAQENLDRGEYEAAISRFNVARSLVPASSGPYLGLGIAYARSGRCEQAVEYVQEYLRRKRKNPKPEAQQILDECRKKAAASAPSPAPATTAPPPTTPAPTATTRPPAPPPAVTTPPPAEPPAPRVVITTPVVPGKLVIDVGPEPATVSVNGNEVAQATRHYEGSFNPGDCQVLAERDGYRAVATTVKLEPGGSETRKLTLQPVKRPLWLGVGIAFTFVAAGTGAGALATYVLANRKPRDSDGYKTQKTATLALQGVFYPTLAVAALGYTLWGVLNRGRVSDGPPLRVQLAPAIVRGGAGGLVTARF
jgi:hypothetical protein